MIKLPNSPFKVDNFVSGKQVPANGEAFDVLSPYNNQVIGQGQHSTDKDIEVALQGAAKGFTTWSTMPLKERSQVMFSFREQLLRQMDDIANCVALESGKTIPEAKAGLMKGVEVLEFALSIQNMDSGARMEVSRGVHCEYRRVPLGIVTGITPFNFPAMVPMWMLPIALIVGNSFVWKPSDKTPLTPAWIAKALQNAGLPDGALTVINGGRDSVETLIDHPLVKAVGFVGSTPVAQSVYRRSSERLKRALALGGAKNHIVLLPDADPEMAGQGIADSFTGCAGQRCMAASTLLAVGSVDPIIEKIITRAKMTSLGERMGAIISKDSLARLHNAIEQAEKDGAKVILDGRNTLAPKDYQTGNWLGATILDNVKPGTQAACEELFGPVLSIIRCENLSEALEIENASPFGNAASVFTQNGALAEEVARSAQAGMLGINIGVPVPREPFSFGGFSDSKFGHGDITGQGGVELWSRKKKITTKWTPQGDQNWMS